MCHRKLKTPPGLHNCRLLPRKRSRSKPCKTPETSEPKRCKRDFMIAPSESTGNLKPQSILRSNVKPLLGLRLGRAVFSVVKGSSVLSSEGVFCPRSVDSPV